MSRFNAIAISLGGATVTFDPISPQTQESIPAQWELDVGPATLHPKITTQVVKQRGGLYGNAKRAILRVTAPTPVDSDKPDVSFVNQAEVRLTINDKSSDEVIAELKTILLAVLDNADIQSALFDGKPSI